MNELLARFLQRVEKREATVAVVGLGYVGLPLAIAFAGTQEASNRRMALFQGSETNHG